ncbi:MAG TPA: hypothetical protein VJ787_12455 [Thermoleophilia bacterium]|nr:hypothetical protein [Thermoleophilia bacterium]
MIDGGYASDQVDEIMGTERVGDELVRDLFILLESDAPVADALARNGVQELGWVLEDSLDAIVAAADGLRLYCLRDAPVDARGLALKVALGGVLHKTIACTQSRDVRRGWLTLGRLEDEGEAVAATLRMRLSRDGSPMAGHWSDIVELLEQALHGCQHAAAIRVAAGLQPA